jgi:hypothetical protein
VVLHTTYVLRNTYHKVVVLYWFFWFWREIVFGVSYIWYLLYNTVVRLCQFLVLAGNWFWFYILMYLEYYNTYNCGVVLVFWFWREIVLNVTYVFSVQYSCAVVSVFWLWRELVLKMRTRFYKKNLLGYFIMIQ